MSTKPATARAPLPSTPELTELVQEYERAFADANLQAETDHEAITLPAPESPPSGLRMSLRQNATARARRDRRERESRDRRDARRAAGWRK